MLERKLPTLNLLRFDLLSIFEQLQVEEALLRTGSGNWCILNSGSPLSAIVMGISGKAEEHIEPHAQISVIRRFSGGGTVVVDDQTCFFSLILDHDLFSCSCPKKFLAYCGSLIKPAFSHLPFQVSENDFTLDDQKIGGNAQHFTNLRRIHHTSFLWDYSKEKMSLLKFPSKVPQYRKGRDHNSFCTTLKDHFSSKNDFLDQVEKAISSQFTLHSKAPEDVDVYLSTPHRQSLVLLK